MHTTDKVNQFIELRAKGLSIPRISEHLKIPASTLYDWNERHSHQVQGLKRAIFEEIEERVLGTAHLQFDTLACALKAIDRQIAVDASRDIRYQKLPALIRMSGSLRRQLHSLKHHAFEYLDTTAAIGTPHSETSPPSPTTEPKP